MASEYHSLNGMHDKAFPPLNDFIRSFYFILYGPSPAGDLSSLFTHQIYVRSATYDNACLTFMYLSNA